MSLNALPFQCPVSFQQESSLATLSHSSMDLGYSLLQRYVHPVSPYMYSIGVVGCSTTNPFSLTELLQLQARGIMVISSTSFIKVAWDIFHMNPLSPPSLSLSWYHGQYFKASPISQLVGIFQLNNNTFTMFICHGMEIINMINYI
jgi:hypothetical protein